MGKSGSLSVQPLLHSAKRGSTLAKTKATSSNDWVSGSTMVSKITSASLILVKEAVKQITQFFHQQICKTPIIVQ